MSRYARRTDANQVRIVQALRQLGLSVLDLSKVGGGCPDLLVRRRDGSLALVEIKNPDGRNRIGEAQAAFASEWPVTIIRTVDEAIAWSEAAE